MAGGLGVEPRFTDSKSVVLPLDDPPLLGTFNLQRFLLNT